MEELRSAICGSITHLRSCTLSLQRQQRSPAFGSHVIAQAIGHGNIKHPIERSVTGRLIFWDHLSDQGSFILCPPDAELGEEIVYKAGLPFLAPPDTLDDSSSQ